MVNGWSLELRGGLGRPIARRRDRDADLPRAWMRVPRGADPVLAWEASQICLKTAFGGRKSGFPGHGWPHHGAVGLGRSSAGMGSWLRVSAAAGSGSCGRPGMVRRGVDSTQRSEGEGRRGHGGWDQRPLCPRAPCLRFSVLTFVGWHPNMVGVWLAAHGVPSPSSDELGTARLPCVRSHRHDARIKPTMTCYVLHMFRIT